MEIENFIPDYLFQNDKRIQWDISTRQEFRELAGKKNETFPEKGKFFPHQEIIFRYLRIYDKVLNINEPGTGKAGSFIRTSEFFRANPGRIKKGVILQPGNPTIEDFKNQLVELSGNYNVTKAYSEKSRKNLLTRSINEFYEISGYQTFSTRVSKLTDNEIIEEYSDTIFLLEELHKLRNVTDDKEVDAKDISYDQIYKNIWKVLHLAKRIKIVENTATPHINVVNDFIPLLNLLLPMNNQLSDKIDYSCCTVNHLEPFFRGKITYVRSIDFGLKINYIGKKLSLTHKIKTKILKEEKIPTVEKDLNGTIIKDLSNYINVEEKEMETVPSKLILNILYMEKEQSDGYVKSEQENKTFKTNQRQATLFIFPDGSHGSEGFNKNTQMDEKGKLCLKEEFKKYISVLDNLKKCSIKYYTFIESELKNDGASYGYLEELAGGGINLLSLILEVYGFSDFTHSSENPMILKNSKYELNPNFTKKKRFATITSNTSQNNIDSILRLRNSNENYDGEYLKIVIVSKMAQVGINIYHTVRSWMFSAPWHKAGMNQALARAIRSNSHNVLFEKKGSVSLNIYLLAIENTVDMDNYIKAEEKDIYIQKNLQIMKICAFDAILNYKRNVKDKDDIYYPFSAINLPIDFESEELAYGLGPKEINYKTYDIFYSIDEIETLQKEIIELVKSKNIIKFEGIRKVRKEILYLTLDKIINDKITIRDDFGNQTYVIVGNGIIYRNKVDRKNFQNDVNKLELTRPMKLSKFTKEQIKQTDLTEFDNLSKEEIIEKLKTKEPHEIMSIIENFLIKLSKHGISDTCKKMVNIFYNYIGGRHEPLENLRIALEIMEKPKTGSGRQPKDNSSSKLKNFEYNPGLDTKEGEMIYFHYYNGEESTSSYNVTANTRKAKKIRLYKASEGVGFRNANIIENVVYSVILDKKIKDIENKLGTRYASIIHRDGKFRIHSKEGKFAKNGIVCESAKNEDVQKFYDSLCEELKINPKNLRKTIDICNELRELTKEYKKLKEIF